MASSSNSGGSGKRGKGLLLSLGGVGVLAVVAGLAAPLVMPRVNGSSGEAEGKRHSAPNLAFVSFGEVTVNLAEERLTRYLRAKLVLVVEQKQEKAVTENMQKNKAILKNWLISHLRDKSIKEVSGAAGVNRLRREILEQFTTLLSPGDTEPLQDVLFEEFVVQ
jgi:flagellar basal body-associated protein FliL